MRHLTRISAGFLLLCLFCRCVAAQSGIFSIGSSYLDPSGPGTRELSLMTLSLGKQLTGRVSVGGELLTTGEVPAAIAIGTLVVLANTCGSDGLNDDLFSPPPPPPSHEPPRAVEQSQDSGVSALGADLWLHWDVVTRKKWSLFADASIGLMTFHRPFPNFDGAFTSAVVRNGLGVSYRLSESMFLQGGVRHMLLAELGSNDYRRGLEYWVGIGFRF